MATETSIAIRKADAQERIAKAAAKLAKSKGVEVPDLAPTSKDPGIQGALQLEAVADFLESVTAAPNPAEKAAVAEKPAEKADNGKGK